MRGTVTRRGELVAADSVERVTRRLSLRRRSANALRRFWRVMIDANVTGSSAMVAYNMLLAVVPVALLALFVGGQILSSHSVQQSVLRDLRDIFPGTDVQTLNSLLTQIQSSTTSTGVLALLASLWLGSSFWGALDTAFARIYGCKSRPWLKQKRFALGMLIVVLLFMIATVAVPTVQSILKAGASALPFDLAGVTGAVYAISLLGSLALLFGSLAMIYARVPNRPVGWRGVWPGAMAATIAIGVVDFAFPLYLTSISTIAQFGTTIVFILIMLGWFYVVALVILSGAIVNAMRLGVDGPSELERA
jgi:membrane protein